MMCCDSDVSVLFSEPKIPQVTTPTNCYGWVVFQCSSASRKFLNASCTSAAGNAHRFQCSSASRKFLKNGCAIHTAVALPFQCSSASRKFLKPRTSLTPAHVPEFQCSSASRKFLKFAVAGGIIPSPRVSVLFSEPKIPQMRVLKWFAKSFGSFSALQRAENSSSETPARS